MKNERLEVSLKAAREISRSRKARKASTFTSKTARAASRKFWDSQDPGIPTKVMRVRLPAAILAETQWKDSSVRIDKVSEAIAEKVEFERGRRS